MIHRTTAVTAVVLLVLVGCAPAEDGRDGDRPPAETDPHKLHAKATVVNGGISIVTDVHETALVRPGDRVDWVCECSPEIQFAISEPEAVLEVEKLLEAVVAKREDWSREAVTELAGRLPEAAAYELEESSETRAGQVDDENYPIAAARELLEAIAPALPERPEPGRQPARLFDGDVPREFVDANGTIRSPAVRANPGDRMWKFAWKFRLKDDPQVQKEWDPHLYSRN